MFTEIGRTPVTLSGDPLRQVLGSPGLRARPAKRREHHARACGRLDGYYERGLNLWDYAAAGLVASQAGARVGGLAGTAASGEILVAAVPAIFTQLAGLLEKFGADRD